MPDLETPIDNAAPPAEAPAVEPGPGAAVPSQVPAAPDSGLDYKAWADQQAAENQAMRQWYAQQTEAQSKAMQDFQNRMLEAFAPDIAKQKNAPKYLTEEQFNERIGAYRREIAESQQTRFLQAEFTGAVKEARAKYPGVFETFGDEEAEQMIGNAWVSSGKNPVEIAANIDRSITKAFEKRQAAVVTEKTGNQETIRPVKPGGAGGNNAPASKKKGLARLEEIMAGG